jgi:hypothetical protein
MEMLHCVGEEHVDASVACSCQCVVCGLAVLADAEFRWCEWSALPFMM